MPKGVWSDHTWPVSPVCLDCAEPAAGVPLGALFAAQVPNNDIAIVIASRPRGNLTTSSALISQFQCWPSPICCLLLCIAKSDLATAHIYRDTAMSTNEKAPGRKAPGNCPGAFLIALELLSRSFSSPRSAVCPRSIARQNSGTRDTHQPHAAGALCLSS